MGIGLIHSIGSTKSTLQVGMELMYAEFETQGFPMLFGTIVKQSIALMKEEWQHR